MSDTIIPIKERKRIRDNAIRALYRSGFSMNQICHKEGVSKTTVFFAIKGRRSKKSAVKKL